MTALDVAISAARKAGIILQSSYGRLHDSQIETKERFDFVTDVDRESESSIVSDISAHFPDHSILAEEAASVSKKNPYRWIIDPLDGTNNYVHSFPCFSISIALEYHSDLILGVIYDPLRDELFHAEKGAGAFLNGESVSVSDERDLSRCLFATGFPFKNKDLLQPYLDTFTAVFQRVSGIRRAGSAALDMAYVACGRVDCFWEIKLSTWDIAAGTLILKEAGGKLSDVAGGNNYLSSGNVVATNGHIHDDVLKITKRTFTENP